MTISLKEVRKKKIPVKDLARAKYVRDKIRAIGTVSYTDACKARIDAASIVYQEYRSHAESIGEFIRSSADFRAEMEKRGYRYRRANSGNMVNVALRDTPCIEASVRQDSFESLCRSLKHAVKKLQQSGVPILAEFIIITADQTFIMAPDAGVAFL